MDRLSITGAAYVESDSTEGGLCVLVDVTDTEGRSHCLRGDIWPHHTARVTVERETEYSPPVDEVDITVDLADCVWEDYGDGGGDGHAVQLDKAGARMIEELILDGHVRQELEDHARAAVADGGW